MSNEDQENLNLKELLDELGQDTPRNPYQDYFLLSNPFPTLGQFYGICVNQEPVINEFTRVLRDVYLGSQSRIMTILGSTGAGKTNLLRFLEQTLSSKRDPNTEKKTITDLFTVFVEQPQGSYLEIHRQIISQLGADVFHQVILNNPTGQSQLVPSSCRIVRDTSGIDSSAGSHCPHRFPSIIFGLRPPDKPPFCANRYHIAHWKTGYKVLNSLQQRKSSWVTFQQRLASPLLSPLSSCPTSSESSRILDFLRV